MGTGRRRSGTAGSDMSLGSTDRTATYNFTGEGFAGESGTTAIVRQAPSNGSRPLGDFIHRVISDRSFGKGSWGVRSFESTLVDMADADMTLKEKVKQHLTKEENNVSMYYHDKGLWQDIAKHQLFEALTLVVIIVNTAWMWIDTDLNDAPILVQADRPFQIVEHLFCFYFSAELMIRFMAFREKRFCLRDWWFLFDSCLVLTMVLETWVMTAVVLIIGSDRVSNLGGNATILRIARLLRLTRMARMARLFRRMPELLILLKGIAAATRSVFFTCVLLTLLLYAFAIAMTQMTDDTEIGDGPFKSVASSMYTLLINGILMDDIGKVARELGAQVPFCVPFFWVFVLGSSMTVLNLLIGIVCEVVSQVSRAEREAMTLSFVSTRLGMLFEELDNNGDKLISKAEFLTILENKEAVRLLCELDVDPVDLVDQAAGIFSEEKQYNEVVEKTLNFAELMALILDFRGTKFATAKDIMDLRKVMMSTMAETNKILASIDFQLAQPDNPASRPSGAVTDRRSHRSLLPGSKGDEKVSSSTRSSSCDRHIIVPLASENGGSLSTSAWMEFGAEIRDLAARLEQIAFESQCKIHQEVLKHPSTVAGKHVRNYSDAKLVDVPVGTPPLLPNVPELPDQKLDRNARTCAYAEESTFPAHQSSVSIDRDATSTAGGCEMEDTKANLPHMLEVLRGNSEGSRAGSLD